MVEITKRLKILLLINAIVGLIFAFLYLAISHIYLSLTQWPFYDPYYSWSFGGTLLILSIFTLLAIKRTEWKQIRIIFELIIAWQLRVNNFLLIILIIANIYFYTKQEI